MNELLPKGGSERYGACDDEAPLLAIPMLLVLLMVLLIKTRRRKN